MSAQSFQMSKVYHGETEAEDVHGPRKQPPI